MYSKEKQRELYDLSKALLKNKDIPSADAAADEIGQLHEIIVYHEWRYYVLSEPVVSDYEYDYLFKRLEALEKAFPNLVTPNSPTQRISNDLATDMEPVAHLVPVSYTHLTLPTICSV